MSLSKKDLVKIPKFIAIRGKDKNAEVELFEMPDNYDYTGKFILDNNEAMYYVFDEITLGDNDVSVHEKTTSKKRTKSKTAKRQTRR